MKMKTPATPATTSTTFAANVLANKYKYNKNNNKKASYGVVRQWARNKMHSSFSIKELDQMRRSLLAGASTSTILRDIDLNAQKYKNKPTSKTITASVINLWVAWMKHDELPGARWHFPIEDRQAGKTVLTRTEADRTFTVIF